MTYRELCEKFNFPMPEYAEDYFDAFAAEYDRSKPVLSAEAAAMVADATSLPEDGKAALIRCAEIINNDDDAHLCGSFLADLTVYKRVPWVNYIYRDDLFTVEGLEKEQVGWVLVATMMANTLNNKKPPKALNEENISSFRGYSKNCFESNGYWGILEWHWNMLGSGGCMFMFGILKFVPGEFTGDFPVITDGERYVSLAGGEFFVGKEGELVDCEEKAVGKTGFYEDETKYIGNVISAEGVVDLNKTEFDKSVWKDFLRAGSPTIEIHIPSNIPYTPENIKSAFKMALEFYKDFYPEHKTKAIACYSWILSPQLRKVLPEGSNILAVNDSMHILPVIATFDGDCRFLRKGTSLQKRIAEECEKGTEFHHGIMYVPVDEIEAFGSRSIAT